SPEALAILRSIADSSHAQHQRALNLALRRMDTNPWHNAEPSRTSIQAAGAFGDPASVPWLIDQMSTPPLARLAGEAFTMITGVDIAYQDLDCDKPEGFEVRPTENPEDEDVEMDPDEHLPWPDPQLIAQWWARHQGEFTKGTRHLLG